jgi:hypothetical protein
MQESTMRNSAPAPSLLFGRQRFAVIALLRVLSFPVNESFSSGHRPGTRSERSHNEVS